MSMTAKWESKSCLVEEVWLDCWNKMKDTASGIDGKSLRREAMVFICIVCAENESRQYCRDQYVER